MGLLKAGFTFVIGYFLIEFIKSHKEKLKYLPVISDFIHDDNQNFEMYMLFLAFIFKDFIF
jgi:hypothetical protein